ncbi:MAG: DegT/DnrJ/EryC1/StrS aminotransferase family protein [Casimicrobiaceae bacterium]
MTIAPSLPFARPDLDETEIAGVADVLRSGWIASGPWVQQFERKLSDCCEGRPVRVVTSATAAIEIALQIAGVVPGDEVITCAQTFFTVLNMIARAGARPVFVDCELVTRNLDLAATEAAITSRTKAIVPTHWPGSMTNLDGLLALAKRHGLRVIEDAALVQGSRYKGRPIGGFGDLCTFSFHPNKNMTTIEGGAIVVNDQAEAARVEQLRFHGIVRLADGTRDIEHPSGKFNLPDVNARLGVGQLARLPDFLAARHALVERYFERFDSDPRCLLPPRPLPDDGFSWNMFCVLLPLSELGVDRKAVRDELQVRGIGTGISYEALHLTTLGRRLGYREGQFPNAERIARETLTLPLFSAMRTVDVDRVCAVVADVLAHSRRTGGAVRSSASSSP